MNRKLFRILSVLVIAIVIMMSLSIIVSAKPPETDGGTPTGIQTVGGRILAAGSVICYAAAFVLLMWMGIKWLTSAPEGKAELKKGLIIASVGAILLFGAGTIMNIVGGSIANQIS